MAIQFPPQFPWRPDLPGGSRHIERSTWSFAGQAVDGSERGVPTVIIKFIDRQTNTETGQTVTDANGRFIANVPTNQMGYRLTPDKDLWVFCPAFFQASSNTEQARFLGYWTGAKKDPSQKE